MANGAYAPGRLGYVDGASDLKLYSSRSLSADEAGRCWLTQPRDVGRCFRASIEGTFWAPAPCLAMTAVGASRRGGGMRVRADAVAGVVCGVREGQAVMRSLLVG